MELILLRHTAPNVQSGTCYGQADLELGNNYQAELEQSRALVYKDLKEATIFASPLKRCHQLAEFLGRDFQTDARLKELHFGEWENKPWVEIKDQRYHHWMEDMVNRNPPGGESLSEFYQRVHHFWQEVQQLPAEKLILVTHSGVIRCFLRMALQFPLEKLFVLPLNYGSVTRLNYQREQGLFSKIELLNQR